MPGAPPPNAAPTLAAWLRLQGVPSFVREPGRRTAVLRHPRTFGWTWLVLIVLTVIAVATWPAGELLGQMWFDVPALVVLFALAWVVVAAQLVPIAAFSARWFVRVLLHSDSNLMHVLPLLLVAVTFFFLTTETWQSVGALKGTPFFLSVLLLAVIALLFILRRGQSDTEQVGHFADEQEVRAALPAELAGLCGPLAGPAADLTAPSTDGSTDGSAAREGTALSLAERVNLLVLAVIGRLVAAAFVSLAVSVFFVLLGAITITDAVARSWTGGQPAVWWSATIGGHPYAVTVSHVRVAVFLGVFAGLYFVVSSASDRELARTLSADTDAHLRTCLAVRTAYLASLSATEPAQSNSDSCSAADGDAARTSRGARRAPPER